MTATINDNSAIVRAYALVCIVTMETSETETEKKVLNYIIDYVSTTTLMLDNVDEALYSRC